MTSSLTYDVASGEADKFAQASLKLLPAGAKLDPLGDPIAVPCSDDDGAPDSTPVSVQADYFVVGIPAAQNRSNLDALVKHWRGAGWSVRSDKRPQDQFVSLQKSGYGLVFQLTADGGRLGLSTTTPCVPPKNGGK